MPLRLEDDAARFLRRIAERLSNRDTVRLEILIQDGGVREFKETVTVRAKDLPLPGTREPMILQ